MKAFYVFLIALAVVLAGCSTVTGVVSKAVGGGAAKAVQAEVADFKADELLCGNGDTMMETSFYLAKITKSASEATKNQAEVLYVRDGSKEWVVYALKSHKAKKDELAVDAVVLFPDGWAEYESMTAEEYRKARWKLGRITSTDDLFKGIVEVSGQNFYTQLLRVPDGPIEE